MNERQIASHPTRDVLRSTGPGNTLRSGIRSSYSTAAPSLSSDILPGFHPSATGRQERQGRTVRPLHHGYDGSSVAHAGSYQRGGGQIRGPEDLKGLPGLIARYPLMSGLVTVCSAGVTAAYVFEPIFHALFG